MPVNGYYDPSTDNDNVTDDGALYGWAGFEGYGRLYSGGRHAYTFGPLQHHYGTWGQFIYQAGPGSVSEVDLGNPTGLDGHMPLINPSPDGSNWVQGHLINGECGGKGSMARNLTPIGGNLNAAHRGYEAVIRHLINRGGLVKYFNPNNIANTRFIYRVHALPPPAGTTGNFPHVPAGIVLSLGFVINNVMKSLAEVKNELNGRNDIARQSAQRRGIPFTPRWFHSHYYASSGQGHDYAQKMINMVGGHEINYP
jgi:hypothetical protein